MDRGSWLTGLKARLVLSLMLLLMLSGVLATIGNAYADDGDEAEVELKGEVEGGGGVGPAGAPPAPYYTLEVDMWGETTSGNRTAFGVLEEAIEATSEDWVVTLLLRDGTEVVDLRGKAINLITVEPVAEPPPLPPDAYAVDAYDFRPPCAFEPAIELTISYDEEALPEGFDEVYLVIQYYGGDDEGWRELPTVVDTYANSVSTLIGHFTMFAIVAVLPPSELTIASLLVSPSEVDPGESVTITVEVANTGGTPGSLTVELWVEGEFEGSSEVTLAAGATESVTFTVSRDEAGTYRVATDGLSGEFTVAEEAGSLWPVWLGVGLGILSLALIITMLRKRGPQKRS